MSESSEIQELQEKDVIIDRVRKLFGDDVAQKFQDEEITHFSAIADLLKREADASIFRNLGLKYGSAVRFKTVLKHSSSSSTQFQSMT